MFHTVGPGISPGWWHLAPSPTSLESLIPPTAVENSGVSPALGIAGGSEDFGNSVGSLPKVT